MSMKMMTTDDGSSDVVDGGVEVRSQREMMGMMMMMMMSYSVMSKFEV